MLVCLLLALGAAWLAWLALKGKDAWDALEAMPVTPLADAAEGATARVSGRVVREGAPLRTPLQGRPCVGYRLELTGTKAPRVDEAWATFELEDPGGKASVETGAPVAVLLAHARESRVTPGAPLPAPVAALVQPGDAPTGWRESWVEPGEPATVRAKVLRGGGAVRLVAPEDGPLRLSTLERLAGVARR